MKLAIVGSQEWPEEKLLEVHSTITTVLYFYLPEAVGSGGCVGVDKIAEERAKGAGIRFVEFPPKNRRWAPNGFKERNILIAEWCDVLVCIRNEDSKTYGSGWTADYAYHLGKKVRRYLL